jgi:sn-glycerol 3-phosphate transport system ATP-binding protein
MSVFDNMAYGLRNRGTPKPEIERRVNEAARLLAIDELLQRKPRALSGGQRQRVAMGRAIVREPQAFLFDEPLSNLDAKLRVQTRIEIRRLHNRLKATSIFVTHDQVEAMTLADTVVVMNAGQVEQSGAPTHVYRRPATRFVATFIGSPAMTLLKGRVADANELELAGGRLKLADGTIAATPGQDVEIGIRSEDLTFSTNGAGLPFKFEFVEELGPNRLLHGTTGGEPIVVSVPSASDGDPPQSATLHAPPDAVHVFDARTGKSLRR